MLKVILLIVLFNSSTGELKGVWSDNGNLPSFETVEQCEAVIEKDLPQFTVPDGFSLSAKCIFPGEVIVGKGVRT